MNRTKYLMALVTVLLIGSAAVVLAKYKSFQRLGNPGVVTRPIPGTKNVEVVLPEKVLDFTSEWIQTAEIVTNVLPRDTCYGQRRYMSPDTNFFATANVVLMGEDRASLHQPQYCLTGAGWVITKTEVTTISMEKPFPYELPVIKLTVSGKFKQDGRDIHVGGIYTYWYVNDKAISANPRQRDRMWSMARTLLTTGVLERWAYISYFTYCNPGQEEAAFERMKPLIAASVPEFQLVPVSPTPAPKSP